jgi:hypothetical protein
MALYLLAGFMVILLLAAGLSFVLSIRKSIFSSRIFRLVRYLLLPKKTWRNLRKRRLFRSKNQNNIERNLPTV